MLKVCDAMAYAHAKGVIHRDLKPGNVMVGRFGEVHVMDWGLARIQGQEDRRDLRVSPERATARLASVRRTHSGDTPDSPLVTMDGHVIGTPAYMPPEQALGELAEIGPHSDVYAVGAMLYHMLAGQAPYLESGAKPSNHALWYRVREGPPRPLHELAPQAPAELLAITEKAMARDWRERYRDMGALAGDLRAWLERRVVRAYESGRFAELRKWIGRNRLFAASVAVSLALFLAGTTTTSVVLAGKNRALSRAQLDSDELVLLGLEEQQWELGPAEPGNTRSYSEWLANADGLVMRVEGSHRAELERMTVVSDGDSAAADLAERSQRLATFVERAARFSGPTGSRLRVARSLELALTLRERSLDDPDVRARWTEARESIADREESPAYEGFQLEPQLGLVPIGVDSESGLWEFWHVGSGDEPDVDEQTGRVLMSDGDGVVLVLIPGGKSVMGAQGDDPSASRYDPDARPVQEVLREIELQPFFLSKYELTQDQWSRMAGTSDARYRPPSVFGKHRVTSTHPAEQVDWNESAAVLRRFGLTLPTEAQWEHAARAGTETIWWTGNDKSTLRGSENLADQSLGPQGLSSLGVEAWDDGHLVHAPVGSFKANPFGLFDVAGNVKEWCLDWMGQGAPSGFAPGTGERIVPNGRDRAARGGSFFETATTARSAFRGGFQPDEGRDSVGVRPARLVMTTAEVAGQ